MDIRNKQVCILGFKKSGQAAAKLAFSKGGHVFVSSDSDYNAEERNIMKSINAEYETLHSDNILNNDIIVTSPGIPYSNTFIQKASESGIHVIPEIEFAYNFSNAVFIGITGTNGKSTTAFLTYQLLKSSGKDVELGGNISPGTPLSEIVLNHSPEIIICELSSFQLETVDKFNPHIGVITNISPDHLNRHGDMETYINCKMNIFRNQDKSDYAVLNMDDDILNAVNLHSNTIYTSLLKTNADIFYSGNSIHFGKDRIDITEFKLPGNHNIENLMQAIAVFNIINENESNTQQYINSLVSMPHRMEYIGTINNHRIYNNSMCTNPVAFKNSVESLSGRQTVILGGRNKDFDIDIIIDAVIKNTHNAILIGESTSVVKEYLISKNYKNIFEAESLHDAVKKAFSITVSDAPINFSPGFASFDMFTDFADRGNKFKEEIKEWE